MHVTQVMALTCHSHKGVKSNSLANIWLLTCQIATLPYASLTRKCEAMTAACCKTPSVSGK